jgi:multidrug efflux pump subunit AcrB
MKRKQKRSTNDQTEALNLLQRFSLFFFKHARTSVFMWIAVLIFGVLCYTTFLQRQGFPSIDIPVSTISGTYFVNDEAKVDHDLARPVSQAIANTPEVKSVTTKSDKNFATFIVEYNSGITSAKGSQKVQQSVARVDTPSAAKLQYQTIDAAQFDNKYDLIVSTYGDDQTTSGELTDHAQNVAHALGSADGIAKAEVIDQFKTAQNPVTGTNVTMQDSFDRFGTRENGQLMFHNAVSVGVIAKPHTDALKLYDAAQAKLDGLPASSIHSIISADFAESIRQQVHALQDNLGEGLIIVIIVSFLLISWRAGLATALSMATVLFMTVGALKLFGYTLNTITLFALILSLGLIVDDTTIVAEAIDANQKEGRSRRDTVALAIKRVARASVAGTSVTILTFAPMLFIGGILGSFIRALPITIITSIALSLVVSLALIPFLSRSLVLTSKPRNKEKSRNPVIKAENFISSRLASTIRWTTGRRRRQLGVAAIAFAISFGFLMGSFSFFSKLKFDIFPAGKDSDAMTVTLQFAQGTTLPQAEAATDHANTLIGNAVGTHVQHVQYLSSGSAQTATAQLTLDPFTERSKTAPMLHKDLDRAFTGFEGATVTVAEASAGPPKDEAPFKVQIHTEDTAKAQAITQDLIAYLQNRQITRPNGTNVTIVKPELTDATTISRKDGQRIFEVHAGFSSDDTSALVTLAQKDVQKAFDTKKIATYGLDKDAMKFDFGEEQENQDSFKSMMLAFPVLLIAMFVLLAVFFRSLLQPLLIFMAIPFSFFGVAAGLHFTDNPLSFFVMIGFFALIGIAVNNTIMLVDYANQERRSGKGYTESMAQAIHHRFRPLLTTSLTSMVALTPLALSDPFWQPLAVTLIFGLLSSTFLVVVSFPYYWLAAEWLRLKTKQLFRRIFRRPRKA